MWRVTTEDRRYTSEIAPCEDEEEGNKCVGKEYNYYINQLSCTGLNAIGSSYMFAVDDNCTTLQLFDEVIGEWCVDTRVCAQRGNLRCSHLGDTRTCNLSATCHVDRRNDSCTYKRYHAVS